MNRASASASSAHLDLLGTCLSLVCASHCLSVPLLVTVLPIAGAGMLLWGMAGGPVHRGVVRIGFQQSVLGLPATQAVAGVYRARRRSDHERCRAVPGQRALRARFVVIGAVVSLADTC
jgi:hypothetical protein